MRTRWGGRAASRLSWTRSPSGLTGFENQQLAKHLNAETTVWDFFAAAWPNPNVSLITGSIRVVIDTYLHELERMDSLARARITLWADAAASGSQETRDEASQSDQRFRSEIAHRLHAGIEAGEIAADVDVDGFVTVLIGLLRGVALQFFLDADLTIESARREAYALITARLTA